MLTGVLDPWLRAQNRIQFKGREHAFSDASLQEAVERLTHEPLRSLLITNERIYELLTLGTSLRQTIDGDHKSFSLRYID